MKRLPKPIFYGEVKQGCIKLYDPASLKVWLSFLEGKEIQVRVERKGKARSHKQNNYYWGVVVPILAEYWGLFDYEVDDILKNKFLKYTDENGRERTYRKRDLTTLETELFYEQIRMWASAEENCFIPLPNEEIGWE